MTEQHPLPGTWRLFRIWASIGLQSFGGGASTLLLVQRAFIDQTGWVTKEEYLRLWNLCQLAPGINLIALTALLGKRFGGVRGIVVSLLGMLAPSSAITCLLAAIFTQIERAATTQAILRGVIPATGGIMMLVLYNFVQPLLHSARRAAPIHSLLSVAFVIVCAVLVIFYNVSAIVVIVGMGLLGAVIFSPRRRRTAEPGEERSR